MMFDDRPVAALVAFAEALGWRDLQLHQDYIIIPPGIKPTLITYYSSGNLCVGRNDFFLQINESPVGAVQTYQTAVYAFRYKLHSGWHKFRLNRKRVFLPKEASRLEEWLHRRWFDSPVARSEYRKKHPECVGYSWKQIQAGRKLPGEK